MGTNVDLCQMLGVPEKVVCPDCNTHYHTHFDDYDIECGNPNPEPGMWRLRHYCPKCNVEQEVYLKITATAVCRTCKQTVPHAIT